MSYNDADGAIALFLIAALIAPLAGCEKAALDRQVDELCARDGGVTVYETVALPPEKFDKVGWPLLPGRSRDTQFGSDYRYERERHCLDEGAPFQLFSDGELCRTATKIIRVADEKVLGLSVSYSRLGGEAILLGHPSSKTCPVFTELNKNLTRSVFVMEKG